MRTPTAADWLRAWERGGEASAAARSLYLLGAGDERLDDEALLRLPLGRRDALLLRLHARLFGRRLDGIARCAGCGATVETSFDADALLLDTDAGNEQNAGVFELQSAAHDLRVRFRAVNCADLLALQSCTDVADARRLLLERCVIDTVSVADGTPVTSLPDALQAELAQAMAAADPQADLQLAFHCPDCGHDWEPAFDIARFLWQELHAWALRLLREVDTLARHYHWSEADILAMTPRRRQAYLEQCAS
ncbi:hypothetical protein [Dyella sp. 2RAB6]|uniref:T4 family baseplate hub assembly chaperone n=1 Tax=Dyella sp. 2RAB6 TaxID=3232992 RepID=UPI003F92B505